MSALKDYEFKAWGEGKLICGIDEAGRGPLAGPCVVAGVVLEPHVNTDLIDDSKVLSEKKRILAYDLIMGISKQVVVEIVDVETIDQHNIYRATQLAMEKIASKVKGFYVLTDAMPLMNNEQHTSLIKGDHKSVSIASASIIAKVTRDRIMLNYDALYPEYGFKQHKGYPTKAHYEAIEKYGVLPIHRKSFKLYRQTTLF